MALTVAAVAAASVGAGMLRPTGTASAQAPAQARAQAERPPVYGYEIVRTFPHDRGAFTQGLQYRDGMLYEGTGQHGRSSIRRVNLETGEVVQRRNIPAQYFGEGIALVGSELFQLTWQENTVFVYDVPSFNLKTSHTYRGEGWGLTYDGTSLLMSDGTDQIRFIDPATFSERRRIRVTNAGRPLRQLNELEMIKGELWANVWQTENIVRINPETGAVVGLIDLSGLLTRAERERTDVLNGIAYDSATDRIFVTGKLWPKLFEIRLRRR